MNSKGKHPIGVCPLNILEIIANQGYKKYTAETLYDRYHKNIGMVDVLVRIWYADIITASDFKITCDSKSEYDNHYVLMRIDG